MDLFNEHLRKRNKGIFSKSYDTTNKRNLYPVYIQVTRINLSYQASSIVVRKVLKIKSDEFQNTVIVSKN